MKGQLTQYVELLFAGAADCEDIKQEILQNTLDRYDDLIAEGKTPEAAYRLAIVGIGDVNEILSTPQRTASTSPRPHPSSVQPGSRDTTIKKLMRAFGVALYILCPVPVLVLGVLGMGVLGVCGLLAMVAVATVLVILGDVKEDRQETETQSESRLSKSIGSLLWAIGLAIYIAVSFLTGAWQITWIIFPITGAVHGLISAILDLKEAK